MNANIKEIESKIEQEKIKLKSNTPSKKEKKKTKKKIKKKKTEKACRNLKELLEQMEQEEKDKKLLKKKNLKSKEEIEEKNINTNNKSTSGTTTGTLSLDDNNMPNYLLINNNNTNDNIISQKKTELIDDNFNKKRKMSSPIFDYYIGCDKILSREKEGSIDITNSLNFVDKKKFIPSFSDKEINKIYVNPKDNDLNDQNYIMEANNQFNINNNNNNNIIINQNFNNINFIFNNPYDNNDLQKIIYNINNNNINNINNNNINQFYYLNAFSFNNEKVINKKAEKKYKNRKSNLLNHMRKGDWICNICNNLNFSFRKACNICHAPKQ